MQTLKKRTCPSLSGNSKIKYEIGVEPDHSLSLRLIESSGGGFVSKSWVAMDAIVQTLQAAKPPFTSYCLHPHFKGKSVNSLSFLMAVLRHEGIVTTDKTKPLAFVADGMEKAVTEFSEKALATTKRKSASKTAVSQNTD